MVRYPVYTSGHGSTPATTARMARRVVRLMFTVSPASTAASQRCAVLRCTPVLRLIPAANRTSAAAIHSLNRSGVTASPRIKARRGIRQSRRSRRFVAFSWQDSYSEWCPRPESRRRFCILPVVPNVGDEDTEGKNLERNGDVRQVLHRVSSGAGRDHPAPSALLSTVCQERLQTEHLQMTALLLQPLSVRTQRPRAQPSQERGGPCQPCVFRHFRARRPRALQCGAQS